MPQGLVLVLHDIVKRRFVRTPLQERFVDGDAQSPSYDWRLNRRPPFKSREAGLFVPIPSGAIRVGIGNENDQVS